MSRAAVILCGYGPEFKLTRDRRRLACWLTKAPESCPAGETPAVPAGRSSNCTWEPSGRARV